MQTAIGVVAQAHAVAQGIGALFDPAAEVVLVAGGLLGGVGVSGDLAGAVALIAVETAVRALAFNQQAAPVITVVLAFTACVDALAELAAGIVAVVGFGIGAIAVAEQLAVGVPVQGFVFACGVGDGHHPACGS